MVVVVEWVLVFAILFLNPLEEVYEMNEVKLEELNVVELIENGISHPMQFQSI